MLNHGSVYLSLVSLRYSQMTPTIDALWLEFRTAAQYRPIWDRAEECVALIKRKEMSGSLPTQDDLAGPLSPSTGGSPTYWMQQVYVPKWFIKDELGVGSAVNVYDTARGLEKSNKKRRRDYDAMLLRLASARKVLKRTVAA